MSTAGGTAPGRTTAGALALRFLIALSLALIFIATWAGPAGAVSPLAWSKSELIDFHPPFQWTEDLQDASCPSASFCAAIDQDGNVLTSADPARGARAWKPTKVLGGRSLTDISCPSASLCVGAVPGSPQADGGPAGIVTSTRPTGGRGAWSFTPLAGDRDFLGHVSCPSRSLCFASGMSGVFHSRDPTGGEDAWSATTVTPSRDRLGGISCPSASLCVTVDSDGQIITSTDPTGPAEAWEATPAPNGGDVLDVSCPSESLCVVPQGKGAYPNFEWSVLTSTDPTGGAGAWTATPLDDSQQLNTVDCPSETLCIGVGYRSQEGTVVTSADPTGGADTWQPASVGVSGYLTRATCASDAFCLAGGSDGEVATTTDPTGGAAAWTAHAVDGYSGLYELSCPSESLCVGADGAGKILSSTRPSSRPDAWRTVRLHGGNNAGFLSCASATFCAALDPAGNLLTSSRPQGGAGAWHASEAVALPSLTDFDCVSRSFCIAVDLHGDIATSTDPRGGAAAWNVQHPGDIGQGFEGSSVSCPSRGLCLVSSTVGLGAFAGTAPRIDVSTDPTADDPVWTGRTFVKAGGGAGGISCPATSLCILSGGPGVMTSTTPADPEKEWRFVYGKVGHPVGGAALDCPSKTLCAGLLGARKVTATTHPAGGANGWTSTSLDFPPRRFKPYETANPLVALSCASAAMCVTTDSVGNLAVGRAQPPGTKLTRGIVRRHARRARFAFKSSQYAATGFQCRLKRRGSGPGRYRRCRSPKAYRHLRPGRYVFSVRARNAGGPDPTPAHRSFRIPRG